MDNKKYHKTSAISKSQLDLINVSPAHYRYRMDNPEPDTKPAFVFGSLVHTLILEPDLFNSEYAIAPLVDRRTKIGKERYAKFQKENENKKVISQSDLSIAADMAYSVSQSAAGDLFQNGAAETSVFWEDPRTHAELKCRPDYLKQGQVIDLKTTADASPKGFAQSVWKYRYHVQAAHYLDGFNNKPFHQFIFVAVEKTPPYQVGIYTLSDEYINEGLKIRNRNLDTLLRCKEYNQWGDYSQSGAQELAKPEWMK